MELDNLYKKILECRKCPRLINTRKNPVMPRGILENTEVMFVGMNPGKVENNTGIAFTGKSGKLLNTIIDTLRIENYFITNVCRCWNGDNSPNTDAEINNCIPYLKVEISHFLNNGKNRHIIICLGKQADLGLEKVLKLKMETFKYHILDKNTIVGSIQHPAFILRNPGSFRKNLEFVRYLLQLI